MSRYEVGGDEGRFEPGSNEQVLANKLHITSPEDMDELELVLLRKLYEAILRQNLPERTLTVDDLRKWHQQWLGNVYEWAGRERSVNMTKGEFTFAAADQIPRLLQAFESECLTRFTPCHDLDIGTLARAIAVTHVELVLIHPFRDGNGRLGRLLADVMTAQAGREVLDYSAWDAEKDRYFAAIQEGLTRNYEPMVDLVEGALAK